MSDFQVYTPTEIQENPLPGNTSQDMGASSSSSNNTYSPSKIEDQSIPFKKIAFEVLSTVLNTKSRKILGEFQFTKLGALQIGEFQEGVSGDVRISQNGFVARDKAGNTTVAIDGDTGDAVFAGEVREGSTITGSVQILGGNIVIYDNNNNVSVFIGNL